MMQLQMNERAWVFGERHQVIDMLRKQRESGGTFSVQPDAVHALVQEIDLLQVVAQAAENVATFPAGESAAETLTYLRNSLRRWKRVRDSKRILVVSTDSATRASTARALADLGYVVEFGRTPVKAVEHMRRRRPAAVLVDVGLAPQGCSAFVEACRRQSSGAEMPILVMAATPRAAVDAIRAGAQGCIKAPVDSATLLPMLFQVPLAGS